MSKDKRLVKRVLTKEEAFYEALGDVRVQAQKGKFALIWLARGNCWKVRIWPADAHNDGLGWRWPFEEGQTPSGKLHVTLTIRFQEES